MCMHITHTRHIYRSNTLIYVYINVFERADDKGREKNPVTVSDTVEHAHAHTVPHKENKKEKVTLCTFKRDIRRAA